MGAAKLTAAAAANMFAAGLAPKLAALGFSPVPRVKHTWSRTTPDGVVHQAALELARREAQIDVAIGHPQALAWVAAATGERERLPTIGLQYLYFRGWVPGTPWRDDQPGKFGFDIREESKMPGAIRGFMKSFETHAVPFFARHPTADAIADFFLRKEPYAKARDNWDISRERAGGPAERFLHEDRALLFAVASCALADRKNLDPQLAAARKLESQWAKKQVFGWSPRLAEWLDALESVIENDRKE